MSRAGLGVVLLTVLVSGCGGSSPPATPVPTFKPVSTYQDAKRHFSFNYPTGWLVGKGTGTSPYTLRLRITSFQAHIEVLVGEPKQLIPVPKSTGPLIHRRFTLFGHPAVESRHIDARKLPTAIDTVVAANGREYDIRLRTSAPPLEQRILSGYEQIVNSFRVE